MRLHRVIQMPVQMQKQIDQFGKQFHKGPLRLAHRAHLVSQEDDTTTNRESLG